MKLSYIAGPYRSDTINGIVQNIRNAEKVAIKYWRLGYAVICPHKNTALFDGLLPDHVWLEGDIEIIHDVNFTVITVVVPKVEEEPEEELEEGEEGEEGAEGEAAEGEAAEKSEGGAEEKAE